MEQLLVLLPPTWVLVRAVGLPRNNPSGFTQGDFALTIGDPPACTVGFPAVSWRRRPISPDIDTPDGLYCKLWTRRSPCAPQRQYPAGSARQTRPTV